MCVEILFFLAGIIVECCTDFLCLVSITSRLKVLCLTPTPLSGTGYHRKTLSLLSLLHPVALVTHWKTLPDITGISFRHVI